MFLFPLLFQFSPAGFFHQLALSYWGISAMAHEDNLHSLHGKGKLLLIGRKHTGKCVPSPCPGIETIHIQLHITPLAARSYLHSPDVPGACAGASSLAVPLCAGHAAQGWATAPSTSSKRKCRQEIELCWSRGKKTHPVPAWVQRGLASVAQILCTRQRRLRTTYHTETHAGNSVLVLSPQGLCKVK